jgi:type IV secretion system protein TrbE
VALISTVPLTPSWSKRFGSRWALFFEADRMPARDYPGGCFADPVAWLVDQERKSAFEEDLTHYESRYYLTLLYLPPADSESAGEGFFYERADGEKPVERPKAQLDHFISETNRSLSVLGTFLPELRLLKDSELLSYLHDTISPKRMAMALPEVPAYLDAILCDSPLTGGTAPKLGDAHLRSLTLLASRIRARPARWTR